MKVHLVSGFLGSGKTTAILQACRTYMGSGIRVGVITNDQGIKLVDADYFSSLNIPGRQVTNGCFCCNYNDLDAHIESLVQTTDPEVIFAESVGSCTDIVATVMKPMLAYRPGAEATVSIFADARLLSMMLNNVKTGFDDSVSYIYNKQLEEAGVIIVSKIDLISASDLEQLKNQVKQKYPAKSVVYQNSLDPESLQQWLDELGNASGRRQLASLEIDYDIYGEGEAKLAWFDQRLEIHDKRQSAQRDAIDLVNTIRGNIVRNNYPIGHLKFLLNGKSKISFTGDADHPVGAEPGSSESASLLINARIQTEPETLSALVADAVAEVERRSGCSIAVSDTASFKPGYPRPTHRL